jgi:hypothetical protein
VKGSHALIVPYVGHVLGSLMKLLNDPSSSVVGAALSTIGMRKTQQEIVQMLLKLESVLHFPGTLISFCTHRLHCFFPHSVTHPLFHPLVTHFPFFPFSYTFSLVHNAVCFLFYSVLNRITTGELALASPESVSEHLDVLFPKLIEVQSVAYSTCSV